MLKANPTQKENTHTNIHRHMYMYLHIVYIHIQQIYLMCMHQHTYMYTAVYMVHVKYTDICIMCTYIYIWSPPLTCFLRSSLSPFQARSHQCHQPRGSRDWVPLWQEALHSVHLSHQILTVSSTVDGCEIQFAPPKKPGNDECPEKANKQWS